jgi:hypothetical protein
VDCFRDSQLMSTQSVGSPFRRHLAGFFRGAGATAEIQTCPLPRRPDTIYIYQGNTKGPQ